MRAEFAFASAILMARYRPTGTRPPRCMHQPRSLSLLRNSSQTPRQPSLHKTCGATAGKPPCARRLSAVALAQADPLPRFNSCTAVGCHVGRFFQPRHWSDCCFLSSQCFLSSRIIHRHVVVLEQGVSPSEGEIAEQAAGCESLPELVQQALHRGRFVGFRQLDEVKTLQRISSPEAADRDQQIQIRPNRIRHGRR
jgi:hypothetical protein